METKESNIENAPKIETVFTRPKKSAIHTLKHIGSFCCQPSEKPKEATEESHDHG